MPDLFDSDAVAVLGWRQGAILGAKLAEIARAHAPKTIDVDDTDWLIVTSHDCDIVNFSLDKEPVVEVLRGSVEERRRPEKQRLWGRNPRTVQLALDPGGEAVVLGCSVHDRWTVPREILVQEAPARCLGTKERRLIAEWLAKRYIRAAFPTAFDRRWRSRLKAWLKLLKENSDSLQGVYLRLNTLDELEDDAPYKCHLIVAVPAKKRTGPSWAAQRARLEEEVQGFWNQFEPGIECVGVEALGTDELTLADIEPYQRFDADWVSFDDDTETTPLAADMTA